MRVYRTYVDTSVFGGTEDKEFQAASRKFFAEVKDGRFQVLVSSIVTDELQTAPKKVRQVLDDISPSAIEIVSVDERVKALAKAYIAAGAVTKKSEGDALHVAAATLAKADVIVSWNFKHIVNFGRIKKFNGVNSIEGYWPIEIRSPLEVIYDEEG